MAGVACSIPPAHPTPPDRVAIAVSERYERGTHLVAIDERGDRILELIRAPDSVSRDSQPAISPDGRWIVFASSRTRPLDRTSLWIAPLEPEAVPALLTDGSGIDPTPHSLNGSAANPGAAGVIDGYPAWKRDGSAVIFASTRRGSGFDLYELAIDNRGHSVGRPRALTSDPGHEVAPSVAADGTIVYNAVRLTADGKVDSRLEALSTNGAIVRLTPGPGDTSGALSPDGTAIAFARPVARASAVDSPPTAGVIDSDLWLATATGGSMRHLVDIPLTDESGPVWSLDGRFVFATSVLRGALGDAVFSAVIVVDVTAPHPVARILVDRTGPVARLTPAVIARALDPEALNRNPEYLAEIARITAAAIVASSKLE